ncbi:hypothetical protein FALBO_7075 [Fusarium albosuccineum]|uniref:Myb-like domain-containing protein n=1 Tax=Fusarium albosuccineum TaxID=1237068 RepID=A0A8H4LDJ8_9HYPO|nr:hypothetical protein FALBO_7075 [Fusarium albosuccineum]
MSGRNLRSRAVRPGRAPDPPMPRRATRSSQEAPSVRSAATGRASRSSQPPQEAFRPKKGLLTDPIPRRNPPVDAMSVTSIATNPARPEDETQYEEARFPDSSAIPGDGAESIEGEVEDQVGEIDTQSEQILVGLESNGTKLRILELSVPDLARAADDLMEYMGKGDSDQRVFVGRLEIKRRTFYSIRNEYDDESMPFIDWALFLGASPREGQETADKAIARTNVVTALDQLLILQHDNSLDALSFLQALDPLFPAYFVPKGHRFYDSKCTLDLRTGLLIELLSQQTSKADYHEIIANIFCQDFYETERDYPSLFAGGNFRELGEDTDEDLDELCSTRITEILDIITKTKKHDRISQLKKKFPQNELLRDLRDWLINMYEKLKDDRRSGSVQLDTEPQPSFGDQEGILDSQTDEFGSEPQSIIRAETDEAEPSLFVGKESLRALQAGSRASSSVPPSNQQLAVAGRSAPRDYSQHTNAELLDDGSLPPSSALLLGGSRDHAPSQAKRKRRDPFVEDGEDDDEDDDFETDTRAVDPSKQDKLRQQMPPPDKRPRRNPEPASQPPPNQISNTPSAFATPVPSGPDFQAIKQTAREARIRTTTSAQQRTFWSPHDTEVLVNLVRERCAAWSAMESEGHRFEYPRNQQAYRDKARNLKVEFLITDINLPPCFDLVTLGPKEEAKVISRGKNPRRRENDVDSDGNVTNTEYISSSMSTFDN